MVDTGPNTRATLLEQLGEMTFEDVLLARQRGDRWAVTRTGPRDEIADDVRQAVWRRDGFTCRFCGNNKGQPLTLDHIEPWSAGGSDTSGNLRTLCFDCNEQRSNFVDPTIDHFPLPVTWWCTVCHPADSEETVDPDDVDPDWYSDGDGSVWRQHRRRPEYVRRAPCDGISWRDDLPRVFCAWCGTTSYTVTL